MGRLFIWRSLLMKFGLDAILFRSPFAAITELLSCKNRESAKYFADSLFFYCTFSVSLQIERIILRIVGHSCTGVRCRVAPNVHLPHLSVVLLNVCRRAAVYYMSLTDCRKNKNNI